ncbi:MAG: hypothetical protein ACO1O1_02990 [Adhaeribacter sp.]
MSKLDLASPGKYTFPIASQVLSANIGAYRMERLGDHNEKSDVTKRHHNLDGTCDIYALVEAGGEYLVYSPEKEQRCRIGEGGGLVVIRTDYL